MSCSWVTRRRTARAGGEGGIRTLERACAPYSLSRRVPSATRPPLRGLGIDSSAARRGSAVGTRYARAAVSATGSSPPIAAPTVDREALHARYEAIFDSVTPPFAFVDLDALQANAAFMLAHAKVKPIRIATKSVRS